MDRIKNKFSENGVIIFLLTALIVSQIITFVRLNKQDEILDIQNEAILELVHTSDALFELARLQIELSKIDLKKEEQELNKYQEWRLHEI